MVGDTKVAEAERRTFGRVVAHLKSFEVVDLDAPTTAHDWIQEMIYDHDDETNP